MQNEAQLDDDAQKVEPEVHSPFGFARNTSPFHIFRDIMSPASIILMIWLNDNLVSVVCARCGGKEPAGDFASKRKSAGKAKNCLDCRNFGK